MLSIERHRRILKILQETGSLRTIETAELLGVTHETVRKDLELLERRGELVRIHGGASRRETSRGDIPLTERQEVNRPQKLAIAHAAVKRIQPNETIFIDASSTALTLAGLLPDVPLTILTNALNVFSVLAEKPHYDLMCTGGLFDSRSRSFIGLSAEKSLHTYHIHRMFLSGNGIHPERGVSENNARQAAFKERVIACSEDVVFLADASKLGRKAPFFFGEIQEIGCLVTDSAADSELLRQLEHAGIEIVLTQA